ncbi:bifunctional alpha/beta hydrolase/OsmC family protein [Algoriphagus sp.]|uniref:bifunctional alpha/beta hydrolase/OsmC family protein n=1 Tax=Algoriphagus sp. TaxID=1872435 RepID=UPI0025F74A53|nr:bifunctional alpha/beta hydrolase/OsmC family protein [Algoriphagus sp.]
MNPLKLTFRNRKGLDLAAHLYIPLDQNPRFYAVFAHCFTCSQNFSAVRRISTSLSQQGIAVLSFDFTGLGRSDGEFEESTFSSNISDLLDASDFLERNYESPKMMVGHSLGGAAVMYASFDLPKVEAVITIGAPAFPGHIKKLFKESISKIKEMGSAEVVIGGRPFRVSKQFLEDLEQKPLENMLKKLNKSLLIMHSPQDEIVDIQNAAELYNAAKHPKSFISLDGSDHMVSKETDSEYVGEVIASWSKRYVSLEKTTENLYDTEGNQVKVRLSGPGFTTEIKTPHHHMIADEPLEVGGDNLGPNPYDFLMASLGSCTAMTLKMYADRKKWKLNEVTVFLNHDKVHLNDSKNPSEKESKVSRFTRLINLEGALDEDQRQRLLEISHRCPVHRTLEEDIVIQTLLKKK